MGSRREHSARPRLSGRNMSGRPGSDAYLTLASLREFASTVAGPCLRALRWAGALFPDGLVRMWAGIPFGGVIGIAVELGP
jgi:hypothetical protein